MIGFEPISVQNGGTACVLSGLLHHSAWCRTSNWPMRTVDLCNGLVSGSPSGRGCPVNAAQERSGGAELPVLARAPGAVWRHGDGAGGRPAPSGLHRARPWAPAGVRDLRGGARQFGGPPVVAPAQDGDRRDEPGPDEEGVEQHAEGYRGSQFIDLGGGAGHAEAPHGHGHRAFVSRSWIYMTDPLSWLRLHAPGAIARAFEMSLSESG